jgi:hypothetical protein
MNLGLGRKRGLDLDMLRLLQGKVSLPVIQVLFRISVLSSTWNDPVSDTLRARSVRALKLCLFKGILSTNRLPIKVLTEVSEVLNSGAPSQNGNNVRLAANRQGKVQPRALVNSNHHTIQVYGFKPIRLYCQLVRTRQERRHASRPLPLRLSGAGRAPWHGMHKKPCAGHGKTMKIQLLGYVHRQTFAAAEPM